MPVGAVQSNFPDLETILGITISRIPEKTINPLINVFREKS